MSTLYTMVAPCFFGTESTLNFEVKRLGAQNIQVTDGRVAFQGGADVIAAGIVLVLGLIGYLLLRRLPPKKG